MEDTPHNVDIGHLDPDHISSELHLGEAEEAKDHSTPDTTPQTPEHYSRKPSLHTKWYHSTQQHKLHTRNF